MSLVEPGGYLDDMFSVLLNSLVGGLVGLLVSVPLFPSASASGDVFNFGVPLDLTEGRSVCSLSNDKPQEEKSEVSVRLKPPVLSQLAGADVFL